MSTRHPGAIASPLAFLALALALALAVTPPATALERPWVAAPGSVGPPDAVDATATSSIAWFEICGSSVARFPPQSVGDTFGVVFEGCGPSAVLDGVWIYGIPVGSGCGSTGVLRISEVGPDDAPVDPPLREQPYLSEDGWAFHPVAAPVPDRFVVTVEYRGAVGGQGHAPVSDFPPDDPCIPPRDTPHSFYYGTPSSPTVDPFVLGPGRTLELLWQASLVVPVDISHRSWSSIKSLYR